MRYTPVIFWCLILILAGCKKDKKSAAQPANNGVYITNEGNFTFGNAEVSFYDPTKQEVSNGLFKASNNYALGDVAQSMYIKDSLGFIVVNNSQKIEVVKLPGFTKVRIINIPNSSPRYFLAVNDSVGYVTELYAGKIYVINYVTGSLIKEISSLATWTEHMVQINNTVVVEERSPDTNPSSICSIVTINTSSHSFGQRYSFSGSNIDGIVKDKNNHVWFVAAEDTAHAIHSALYCLNSDFSVNKTIPFATGHHPGNLKINGVGDMLYYFDGDIYRSSIDITSVPTSAFVSSGSRNLYGLGVDPSNEDVYVSDALDYVQPSKIYRYDKNGNQIHSFNAGITSGNFAFKYE